MTEKEQLYGLFSFGLDYGGRNLFNSSDSERIIVSQMGGDEPQHYQYAGQDVSSGFEHSPEDCPFQIRAST